MINPESLLNIIVENIKEWQYATFYILIQKARPAISILI